MPRRALGLHPGETKPRPLRKALCSLDIRAHAHRDYQGLAMAYGDSQYRLDRQVPPSERAYDLLSDRDR